MIKNLIVMIEAYYYWHKENWDFDWSISIPHTHTHTHTHTRAHARTHARTHTHLKTSENQRFSDVFRGYRKKPVT